MNTLRVVLVIVGIAAYIFLMLTFIVGVSCDFWDWLHNKGEYKK